MVEQRLPRREPRLRDRSGFDEINRRRLRCQAASLDGHVLGGPPVAVPVDQAEDLVAHRHAGGAEPQRDHDTRPLMGRDRRSPVVSGSIGPKGPRELGRGETGGTHLHERVADRGLGIRGVLVEQTLDALEALRLVDANGLHGNLLGGWSHPLRRTARRRFDTAVICAETLGLTGPVFVGADHPAEPVGLRFGDQTLLHGADLRARWRPEETEKLIADWSARRSSTVMVDVTSGGRYLADGAGFGVRTRVGRSRDGRCLGRGS